MRVASEFDPLDLHTIGPPIQEYMEASAPPSFLCPISRELMRDPVTLADGHSYERENIEQWFSAHNTSPITGAVLANLSLTPKV